MWVGLNLELVLFTRGVVFGFEFRLCIIYVLSFIFIILRYYILYRRGGRFRGVERFV